MNNWNYLKSESKLWIYGSARTFNSQEIKQMTLMLDQFCDTWAAHGAKLNCGFNILFDRFILLAVDEESAAASGCSIDKSVEIIKRIDEQFQFDLFNRLRSYHADQVTNRISVLSQDDVQHQIQTGELDGNSRIVNMQALRLADLLPNFSIPLKETWLRKYLNSTAHRAG